MNIKLIIASALIIASHCINTGDIITPSMPTETEESLTKLRATIKHKEKEIFKQLSSKENLTKEQEKERENKLEMLMYDTLFLSKLAECVEKNPNKAGAFLDCSGTINILEVSGQAMRAKAQLQRSQRANEINKVL